MREARFLLPILAALAVAGCARQQSAYVIDPATGRQVQTAQGVSDSGRGLLTSQHGSRQADVEQPVAQAYAQQPARQPHTRAPLQQPYVMQYMPPQVAAPRRAASKPVEPQYATQRYAAAQYAVPHDAAPYAYAAASSYESPYTLDAGDKLRIMVFGQDGISNSYIVDAGGNVNLPLIGTVPARGATTQQLARRVVERLKQGYVREPHVSVEVETYRPFFILGEVTNPGQYPYVADMTVEQAIAIAGGFAPRAYKKTVELSRHAQGQPVKGDVPLAYPLRPGDTLLVKERWF